MQQTCAIRLLPIFSISFSHTHTHLQWVSLSHIVYISPTLSLSFRYIFKSHHPFCHANKNFKFMRKTLHPSLSYHISFLHAFPRGPWHRMVFLPTQPKTNPTHWNTHLPPSPLPCPINHPFLSLGSFIKKSYPKISDVKKNHLEELSNKNIIHK